jgi:hypothetical protein
MNEQKLPDTKEKDFKFKKTFRWKRIRESTLLVEKLKMSRIFNNNSLNSVGRAQSIMIP